MKMIILFEIFFLILNLLLLFLIEISKKKNLLIINQKSIKRGKYLSNIANCITCHTPTGSKPFSGGVPLKTKFGTIFTPNITPNLVNGIGKINFKKFKNIIKHGVSFKNTILYPVLPYINYYYMNIIDINAIFNYLKTIPKAKSKNIKNKINFPLNYRKFILLWRIFFIKKINKNYIKLNSSLIRGKYLTDYIGHCNLCHNKSNNLEGNIKSLNYTGNIINKTQWYAPPLINNSSYGIKYKNIQDLSNILNWGKTKNTTITGPMSEIINNSLQNISKIDIKAISTYLKIIFNKNYTKSKYINFKNIDKFNSKLFFIKGKIIYNNNCIFCHGNLTLGYFPNYSNIKKSILDNNNTKNLQNILIYTNTNNSFKNKFNSIMENFVNIIKNKEYKYILNYILFINKLKKK